MWIHPIGLCVQGQVALTIDDVPNSTLYASPLVLEHIQQDSIPVTIFMNEGLLEYFGNLDRGKWSVEMTKEGFRVVIMAE